MPKNKRTRKQKLLSDQRHHKELTQPNTYSLQEPADTIPPVTKPTPAKPEITIKKAITTHDYKYLSKDLWKIIILTSSIIIALILIQMYTNLA